MLGRGGFGITYLAIDERGGGQVAIKEYFPGECAVRGGDHRVLERSGDDHEDAFRWGLDRFRDEGRVLARFDHPNIVRVIGDFEAHGTGYIVMAYVGGETLSTRLAREGPLDEERSLAVVLPIADGLEQVHAAGYLHRDIKPDNIVIGGDGAPVLLDFGAARRALGDRTRRLTAVVSDGYAPLEQYARDSRQGPWTDIYALGAVLYRCLTGRRLPDAPARVSTDELVPLGEAALRRPSQALQDAVHAALAVRVADRPPDPRRVAADARRVAPAGGGAAARRSGRRRPSPRSIRSDSRRRSCGAGRDARVQRGSGSAWSTGCAVNSSVRPVPDWLLGFACRTLSDWCAASGRSGRLWALIGLDPAQSAQDEDGRPPPLG